MVTVNADSDGYGSGTFTELGGVNASGSNSAVSIKADQVSHQATLATHVGLTHTRMAQHSGSVVLVAAPAGYGKTTLLTQVAAATGRKPFASLTIGEHDNDPRHLVAALGGALGIEATSANTMRTRVPIPTRRT
jgi:hypothetical protein